MELKFKKVNICFIEVPEREEKEGEPEKVLKEMRAENFPNLKSDINQEIQEEHRTKPQKSKLKHIIIKLVKTKRKF